jgi:hypothetical protein
MLNLTSRVLVAGPRLGGIVLSGVALWLAPTLGAGQAPLKYNHDIRPILAENCFPCHGPDSASRKAGLRLDHFEFASATLKDDTHAIVPGKPTESELIRRITTTDADDVMPPARTQKTLTAEQKAALSRWIAQGAPYEPHWSLIPPSRAALPKVHDRRWVRNPIDAFILARLETEGLKPAKEADRRTLIRRVTLDLTGLPPTPAEVEAFVKDKSARAYEKVVDRLLASPHYGEHRAHYWLDAARYGDSNGIHFDNYREMWAYRDWVINALNRNETFDQFTIEQLAGDLLPHHTLDQEIASGFNRCNITSNEGGAIDDEYYVIYARDRTETTSQVWLGLTAGCAVCHDHKFDPLSQKEFYSLSAFFNNTTQKAMDGNVQNTAPTVDVPQMEDRPRWEALPGEIKLAHETIQHRRESGRSDFALWLGQQTPASLIKNAPSDTPVFQAKLDDNQTNGFKVSLDGKTEPVTFATNLTWQEGILAEKAFVTSDKTTPAWPNVGDFERGQPRSYGAWVYLTKSMDGALFSRMDNDHDYRGWDFWLQGGKPATHIISKWPEDALKVVGNMAVPANQWTHIFITYDGSAKSTGVKIYIDGQLQGTTVEQDSLKGSIRTKVPFKIGQRNTASPLVGAGLQDARIYNRVLTAAEISALGRDARIAFLLGKSPAKWTAKQKDKVYEDWLTGIDDTYAEATAKVAALEKERADIKQRGTEALVMQERTNAPTAYVLYRGDYQNRREQVTPNTPAALPPMPADFSHDRLGFARWLMLPENPLTARVTVNRFWQEIFGVGLVKTSGDFGVTGDLPSHPELLDWLAVDFRESGWNMKHFFKQVVMSATYRQAAVVTPEKVAKDPENRLLSRGPRFRMDGEMVRDYALFSSGMLRPKIGGPSVKPYQPAGVWEAVAMEGSNTRNYKQDTGEGLYRRSLYTFWKRAAPPASMEIFNAPSRETCTVRRERGDTPLQALVTMDDPQFVEAARHLAELTLKDGGRSDRARLDFMSERLLARPLRPAELKVTGSVLKYMIDHYRSDPKDAATFLEVGETKADPKLDKPTLAAYAMVANELMNLDEVLNK